MGNTMKFNRLPLKDAYLITPEPIEDDRGMFSRVFCKSIFREIGLINNINQINQSYTIKRGSIRGMHYQFSPRAETKIVKCINGSVFDVIIDIRKNSPTYLKWHGETLSDTDMKMIFVPEGFAHGFQTLTNHSEIMYFVTEFYSKDHENGIRYDDPLINIKWPLEPTDISEKDKNHLLLKKVNS